MESIKFLIISVLMMLASASDYNVMIVDNDYKVNMSEFQIGPNENVEQTRTFGIDYENNTFLKDGEPFRYISGSIHYFRVPNQYWRDRLRAMRAAGLNAISTYVEWSFHEPEYRQYKWTGDMDLVKFIKIAEEEGLYVILRPGPYICAERDMGGFPYWLLTKYPNIKLRTSDNDYTDEVFGWYNQLMPKMEPLFYGNGGPIIMVQVENEYGSFGACDRIYTSWLARLTSDRVKNKALLFTTDGCTVSALRCGAIPGIYATVDFGTGTNLTSAWAAMRQYSPKGPLVNSEYYPGWLTHWGEKAATVTTKAVINTLDKMLRDGANVNFYMFYGGTNFGFTAGANLVPAYVADITSYDYDAPLTEAGDPTPKYFAIRDKIGEFMSLPSVPVPQVKEKRAYGLLKMEPTLSLLSNHGRERMGRKTVLGSRPITMEALEQYSGLVLYETQLPAKFPDPSILMVPDLKDRAIVYLNQVYAGILSRTRVANAVAITPAQGNRLQILVENQGRVNYMLAEDYKGIKDQVLLNRMSLEDWTMTSFPLDWIFGEVKNLTDGIEEVTEGFLINGPVAYVGTFNVDPPYLDTYLDMSGWGKGYVWFNERLLGRYWPDEGPQVTLYIPGVYFNAPDPTNTLAILEMERSPRDLTVTFVDKPDLGYVKKMNKN